MDIQKATRTYEEWMGQRTVLIPADLEAKHQAMAADLFSFMRATYYRWVQLWNERFTEFKNAPEVLAVGDLHLENFGTWRDQEGRLVWGINDFDEAFPLPYVCDLVRLAASGLLAIPADGLDLTLKEACSAILDGYATALREGGGPFVLEERNDWLRDAVAASLPDPVKFWKKLNAWPAVESGIPDRVTREFSEALPESTAEYRVVLRTSGLGSLGRQRFTAIADWQGGLLAREAKALLPSANVWATNAREGQMYVEQTAAGAVRCPDPTFIVRKRWTIRRLSPDCGRVKMKKLADPRDEAAFFNAMGRETANVHLGTANTRKKILTDLQSRPADWLFDSAEEMVKAISKDWAEWRKGYIPSTSPAAFHEA